MAWQPRNSERVRRTHTQGDRGESKGEVDKELGRQEPPQEILFSIPNPQSFLLQERNPDGSDPHTPWQFSLPGLYLVFSLTPLYGAGSVTIRGKLKPSEGQELAYRMASLVDLPRLAVG